MPLKGIWIETASAAEPQAGQIGPSRRGFEETTAEGIGHDGSVVVAVEKVVDADKQLRIPKIQITVEGRSHIEDGICVIDVGAACA